MRVQLRRAHGNDDTLGARHRGSAQATGAAPASPKVEGLQWELGAVGNSEWAGVPLAAVLERVGVRAGAMEASRRARMAANSPSHPLRGTSILPTAFPLAKALSPDVLLAHTMNGDPLTPSHSFPLRAVVPGWYGMASVKWLTRIVVTDKTFRLFQNRGLHRLGTT